MNIIQVGKHSIVSDVKNDDKIPVGGSSFLSDTLNYNILVDLNFFETFFSKVNKISTDAIIKKSFNSWLDIVGTDFDPDIFTRLYYFHQGFYKLYPNASSNIKDRSKNFSEHRLLKLSESMKQGMFKCSEYAILAQSFMQQINIPSKLFNGGIMYKKGSDDEHHSFILFDSANKHFIWDPANLTISEDKNKYPTILEIDLTDLQFKAFMLTASKKQQSKTLFFGAKNILGKQKWYYGYGEGGNLVEGNIIMRKNKRITTQRQKTIER